MTRYGQTIINVQDSCIILVEKYNEAYIKEINGKQPLMPDAVKILLEANAAKFNSKDIEVVNLAKEHSKELIPLLVTEYETLYKAYLELKGQS